MTRAIELLKNSFGVSQLYQHDVKKGNKIINTENHLQNAKEIGGTASTPPLATIVLVAIKIG